MGPAILENSTHITLLLTEALSIYFHVGPAISKAKLIEIFDFFLNWAPQ